MSRATMGGTKIAAEPTTNVPGGQAEVSRARTDQLLGRARPRWADDPTVELPCQEPAVAPNPDRDIWFPVRGEGTGADVDADYAASFCRRCPKRLQCLEYGLSGEGSGIWGGVRLDGLKVPDRRRLLADTRRQLGATA